MYLLFLLIGLCLLSQLEIRRKVLNAKGEFFLTLPNSRIKRPAGLQARGLFPAESLSGVNVILLLLCEDDLFFEHSGFNLPEIKHRIRDFIRGHGIAGGSSISQQVVKGLFLQARSRLLRKCFELPYVIWLERIFSKDEILSLYLSNVFFGIDVVGIREAALIYFNKRAEELSELEALLLFISIPAPTKTLKSIMLTRSTKGVDFRKAYWKLKDFYRILHVIKGTHPGELVGLSYAESKIWMSRISRYNPALACTPEVEHAISLRALVSLRDFLRVTRVLPRRTVEQARSRREKFPCEFREVIEAGVMHLRTAAQRRTSVAPFCDWNYVIRLAAWHGMILPLCEHIYRNKIALPKEAASQLQRDFDLRMVRATQIKAIADNLVVPLAEIAPATLFVKGVALKLLTSSPDSIRDPGDIDLLVRSEDLKSVDQVLSQSGFSCFYDHTSAQRSKLLSRGEGIVYTNPEGIHVDVHTRLLGPFGRIFSDHYPFDQTVQLACGIKTMSLQCNLIYLALHGLKHRWSRFNWLLSYARLIEQIDLANWESIFQEASKLNVIKPIIVANRLAADVFEVPIPRPPEGVYFKDLSDLVDSFIFRQFESQLQKYVRDIGRCTASLDTWSQAFAYINSRFFHLGSVELSGSDHRLRKVFPMIRKSSNFLRRLN